MAWACPVLLIMELIMPLPIKDKTIPATTTIDINMGDNLPSVQTFKEIIFKFIYKQCI